jgi:Flp pilus assembly protein TadG
LAKLLKNEKAASAVEFALVFPLLLVMFAGLIDFGMAYWRQHVLTSAARQGARAASLYQSTANVTEVVSQYVRDAGIDTSELSSTVTKEAVPGDTSFMNVVTVRQPYKFNLLPVFLETLNCIFGGGTFPSSITLTGQAKMVIETL